jgi:PAS domain S-box-containing protein
MTSAPHPLALAGYDVSDAETPRDLLAAALHLSNQCAYFLTDIDGVVLSWGLGARQIFGYRADEVLGRPADVLHAPETHHLGLEADMRAVALQTGQWEGAAPLIAKDQSRLMCLISMMPFCGDEVSPNGFVLVVKDVSSRYRLYERHGSPPPLHR